MEYILAFGSPHRALEAECILKEAGVRFRLMPAPKALAEHCDLVISVSGESLAGAREVLAGAGRRPTMVFRKEDGSYVKV